MNDKELKDKMYNKHPFGKRQILNKVQEIINLENKNILIAGCGAGNEIFDLYLLGANITAVDQSQNSIEFIDSQFSRLGWDKPKLIVRDLTRFDYPVDKFDYIVCRGVLHHTEDPSKILDGFKKALKSGGEVDILLYHSKSIVRFEREIVEKLNKMIK